MNSKLFLITSVFILIFFISIPSSLADEKIDGYAYFTWMEEDGSWHEWVNSSNQDNWALLDLLNLKVGQPVKCKIKVINHETATVCFSLYEPGSTYAFDVLSGAGYREFVSVMDGGVCKEHIGKHDLLEPGTVAEYTWTLQVNGNWTSGNAPINGLYHGNFKDLEERNQYVNFVNAYILNENWPGPEFSIKSNELQKSPGFEFILIFLLVASVVLIKKIEK